MSERRVGFGALELLGRHVLVRAEDGSALRQRRAPLGLRHQPRGPGAGRRHARGLELGEAEVEQLDAALGQHDVAGLQVPVHDPLPMRLIQRVGDLHAVAQRLLEGQRPLGEAVGQRLALDQLHHEVIHAVLVADVVQRADMRVGQGGDRLGLALEAELQLRVLRQVRGQHFDRDRPVEPRVPGLVNLPHRLRRRAARGSRTGRGDFRL